MSARTDVSHYIEELSLARDRCVRPPAQRTFNPDKRAKAGRLAQGFDPKRSLVLSCPCVEGLIFDRGFRYRRYLLKVLTLTRYPRLPFEQFIREAAQCRKPSSAGYLAFPPLSWGSGPLNGQCLVRTLGQIIASPQHTSPHRQATPSLARKRRKRHLGQAALRFKAMSHTPRRRLLGAGGSLDLDPIDQPPRQVIFVHGCLRHDFASHRDPSAVH